MVRYRQGNDNKIFWQIAAAILFSGFIFWAANAAVGIGGLALIISALEDRDKIEGNGIESTSLNPFRLDKIKEATQIQSRIIEDAPKSQEQNPSDDDEKAYMSLPEIPH